MGTGLRILLVVAVVVPLPGFAEPVRVTGDRIFVPVTVNGVETEALLDSGAELTLLDAGFARQLGLTAEGRELARGTGGVQDVALVHGVDLTAVGTRLTDRTAAVLDLADISRRLVGEPVMVVLGRELFDAGRFRLDIERGDLSRVSADQRAQGERLTLVDHAGIKQFPVILDGVPVLADFDLGNGSEMLVGERFAAARGWLGADRAAGSKSGGGIGGPVVRDLVEVGTVSIGGVEIDGVVAAVDATAGAVDANIGVSLLRHFVLVIDFPANRLWVDARANAVKEGRAP
ncbi:MAG: retropepsin-like aspartic protease [Pseudomonadota bacterium]